MTAQKNKEYSYIETHLSIKDDVVILWNSEMEETVTFDSGNLPLNWYNAVTYWIKHLWNNLYLYLIYELSVDPYIEDNENNPYMPIYYNFKSMDMISSTHEDGGILFLMEKKDYRENLNWNEFKSIINSKEP